MMTRRGLFGALLAALLVVGSSATAQAQIITFDVLNHPGFGSNPAAPDAQDFGLVLFPPGYGTSTFRFDDVHLTVNTLTGFGSLGGSITHLQSGNPWTLSATFTNISSYGTFNGGQPVPYDNMFADLLNAGNNGGAIVYGHTSEMLTNNISVNLTPNVVNPLYGGPTSFLGKPDGNGNPFLVSFRDQGHPPAALDPNVFPSPTWDVLGASGWFGRWEQQVVTDWVWVCTGWANGGTWGKGKKKDCHWEQQTTYKQVAVHGGDFHFILKNPTTPPGNPVIPEPATGLLMGLGFAGAALRRRFGKRA